MSVIMARMKEKMFFTRKSVAERSMLLITRRPSATTDGMAAKLDSSSTMCETWLAASEPEAMAMEQSASLRASTSLTPSPVMATVCPSSLSARTKRRFWSGVTRPKTVYFSTASAMSPSVSSVRASTYFSAPFIPALFATSETAMALSPEMTFMATPCLAKYLKVSGASVRILFESRMSEMGMSSA